MIRSRFCILFLALYSQSSFAQWEYIGPYGGYIKCMVKDNSNRILVGTPFGGIFRTSDFGENWNQIFQNHLNEDVRSLAVNSSGHIFAGTSPHGIFRSTDDGITWERLFNLVYDRTVISLLIKSDGTIIAGTFSGAYRSTDNGNTFTSINNGLSSSSIYCLAFSGNYILAGTGLAGIFKSSDDGDNWEAANNGINFTNTIVYKIISTDSKNIGAGFRYAAIDNKMYRSSTSDFNWSLLPSFSGSSISDMIIKNNGNLNVTTRGAIYGSANNGDSFTQYSVPQYPYRTIIENSSGAVMTGTEGNGTLVTLNDWISTEVRVNNMTAVAVAGMNYSGGAINVISKHGPVFESTDFGNTWKDKNYNLQLGFSYDIGKNPVTNTTFACNQYGTFRLPENSTVWQSVGIPSQKIKFNSLGNVFLFNGFSCYRSQNDGITFPQVSNLGTNFSDVTFDELDNMYVATANQFGIGVGIKWSNNNGLTFSDINSGLTSLNISAIEHINLGSITNSCIKNIVAASSDGKFFTKNNDNTWNDLSTGLSTNFYTKDISSVNYGEGIINVLVDDGRIAENSNSDCNFSLFNAVAELTAVQYLITLTESGSKSNTIIGLYGTAGSSLLRRKLLPTDVSESGNTVPTEYSLEQNYPNPFNPVTTIRYSIPQNVKSETSAVILKIYDVLGNEVAILVNEEKPAGRYEVAFDASNISSGIYFYKLQSGYFVETKKMVLIR